MKRSPIIESDIDQQLLNRLPILFVFLAAILGVGFAFAVPPLQVPDEFAHFFRAYGISEGYFVAPALTPVPASVARFTGQFPPHRENARKIDAKELRSALREPLDPATQIKVPNEGMNVNIWIPYVPSGMAIFIAREVRLSPLIICYLGRLASLAGYIYLTWLALSILPSGRMALFAVALMPMILHEAAGLTWDSVTYGVAFLFCAMILRARKMPLLSIQDYATLWAVVLILSVCKVDFALLPLLLLIPSPQYGSRRKQVSFVLFCAVSAFLVSAGWQYVNRENLLLFKESVDAQYHTDFPNNIWYLYYNTGYFINAAARTVVQTGFLHLTEFVGTFGWLTVRLPPFIVWLYLAELLLIGLAESVDLGLLWSERVVVSGSVLMGCFGAVLAMWLQTPESYIQAAILHNNGTLYGLQGRHYIPFALPAILLFSNRLVRLRPLYLYTSALALILVANGIGLAKITQTYYVFADQVPTAARPVEPAR